MKLAPPDERVDLSTGDPGCCFCERPLFRQGRPWAKTTDARAACVPCAREHNVVYKIVPPPEG